MSTRNHLLRIYREAALDDVAAVAFLMAWHDWCHRVDDHIDEKQDHASIVDRAMEQTTFMSCPYFLSHARELGLIQSLILDCYRQSVAIERGTEPGLVPLGDVLRLSGNLMVVAVAYLKAGPNHMKNISNQLWPVAWADQHKN